VNPLGDNRDSKKKNTESLVDASNEVVLGIKVEKSKYMFLAHHQNTSKNYVMEIANRLFGKVAQFKYLGIAVKN
jgi:midasin (ATPase involved in ribosome maturation)